MEKRKTKQKSNSEMQRIRSVVDNSLGFKFYVFNDMNGSIASASDVVFAAFKLGKLSLRKSVVERCEAGGVVLRGSGPGNFEEASDSLGLTNSDGSAVLPGYPAPQDEATTTTIGATPT